MRRFGSWVRPAPAVLGAMVVNVALAGAAFAAPLNVDLIVALGGGSSLDCARAINFVLSNGGRLSDYRGYGKASKPMLPMVAVPTTAGQLSAIALGAVAGVALLRTERAPSPSALGASVRHGFAILCLAVLLIVVSSTVGAHHLLGPLLWSPEGKCILALVYTLLFAAFGGGLMKWGAQGAGRMVLLTALIVVPVNFALAGELQLLIHPTAPHLLALALSAAALLYLSGVILAALDSRYVGLFPLAFFALGAFNATMGPDVSFRWGFAAFILLAWVFLGAVWKRNQEDKRRTRLSREVSDRGMGCA